MSHSHSSMAGMDMGDSSSSMNSCEMMMLGNWKTIGSCFLTSSWYISTEAQFAGSCIGVFLLVVLVESVRRWGRELDRAIIRSALASRRAARREAQSQSADCNFLPIQARASSSASDEIEKVDVAAPTAAGASRSNPLSAERIQQAIYGRSTTDSALNAACYPSLFRPTTLQQGARALVYTTQFAGAYIVMLLAMSFNGYMLLSIVLGGGFGYYFTATDTLGAQIDAILDREELLQKRRRGDVADDESAGPLDTYGGASGACCG